MIQSSHAGPYDVDLEHSSVTFRIKHLGLAWYTVRFATFRIDLDFQPDAPETMRVTAEIDTASVRTDYAGPAGDWDHALATRADLLDGEAHPVARFASTAVALTGADTAANTADVTGDLTIRGITRPFTLATTYNGLVEKDRLGRTVIGFSARGTIMRSAYGIDFMLGPLMPDTVELIIEAELFRR